MPPTAAGTGHALGRHRSRTAASRIGSPDARSTRARRDPDRRAALAATRSPGDGLGTLWPLFYLTGAQLERIFAHAARALQAVEDRRPALVLRQLLHQNSHALGSIQGAQIVV